ncbi:rhodopsin [Natronobacterium texcoconense]
MSVAYGFMSAEWLTVTTTGRTESVARFLGYTVSWSAVCFVLGAIVDADRRTTLALIGFVLAAPWATLASWIFDGTAGTVASVALLVSIGGVAYVLLGPLSTVAETVSGERSLLYEKVKNLVLLVFAGLILTGAVSEQNLGLTGAFVGQTVATYLDLIWLAGFGAIVLRYGDVLEAEEVPSPLAAVTSDGRSA